MIGRKHKIKQKHGEQKGELNRNREEKNQKLKREDREDNRQKYE